MKLCPKCNLVKDETEFYNSSRRKNGRTCYCKQCQKEYREANKERYKQQRRDRYLKKREEIIQKSREYREKNAELLKQKRKEEYWRVRDERIARNMAYYYNNRDYVLKRVKKYTEQNKEKITERAKEYARSPKGRATQARSRHNRYYREKRVDNTLTAEQWQKIIESQNNRCILCGIKFTKKNFPTRDHIIPVSKGGGLTFENVQALCHDCNSMKQATLDYSNIITWLSTQNQTG